MQKKNAEVIGIISDTHDNMPAIEKAVMFFNENDVDIVLHAGDIISPFTALAFKNLKSPFIGIFGNNDGDKVHLREFFSFSKIGEIHDDPYISKIGGKNIAITHKPEIVDSFALKYDIVIYGHTHEKDLRRNKALVLNPGECCGYLTGKKSVALLYPAKMDAKIADL
ncbi:MAG: metallophosphoesterase [Candidatus Thermoplasmatota archaeon]|nr:metallophosphoesterase [Candidatus Thermoplasmatota archaeon]